MSGMAVDAVRAMYAVGPDVVGCSCRRKGPGKKANQSGKLQAGICRGPGRRRGCCCSRKKTSEADAGGAAAAAWTSRWARVNGNLAEDVGGSCWLGRAPQWRGGEARAVERPGPWRG